MRVYILNIRTLCAIFYTFGDRLLVCEFVAQELKVFRPTRQELCRVHLDVISPRYWFTWLLSSAVPWLPFRNMFQYLSRVFWVCVVTYLC